jgi:hypothetical protein
MVVAPEGGAVRDLTPGLKFDVPPFSLEGGDDYEISPDGKEVVYAADLDENQATSTNWEIYTVPIDGGEARKISTSPGRRRRAEVFARRQVDRVAAAGARGL